MGKWSLVTRTWKRSILFNCADKSVNKWLNKKLKRTEFMPFAPATLKSESKKCIKN